MGLRPGLPVVGPVEPRRRGLVRPADRDVDLVAAIGGGAGAARDVVPKDGARAVGVGLQPDEWGHPQGVLRRELAQQVLLGVRARPVGHFEEEVDLVGRRVIGIDLGDPGDELRVRVSGLRTPREPCEPGARAVLESRQEDHRAAPEPEALAQGVFLGEMRVELGARRAPEPAGEPVPRAGLSVVRTGVRAGHNRTS